MIGGFADPADAPDVRPFLSSEAVGVRVQATRALGAMARLEDAPVLVAALDDPQWWVRYRAAEGLVAIAHAHDADLGELIGAGERLPAIVDQALADRRAILAEAG